MWVSDYSQTYGLFLVKEINEIEKLSLDSLGVMIIKPNIEELINSTTIFNSSYEDATYLLFDGDIPIFYSPTLPSEDVRLLKEQLTSDYKVISSIATIFCSPWHFKRIWVGVYFHSILCTYSKNNFYCCPSFFYNDCFLYFICCHFLWYPDFLYNQTF